MDGMAKRNDTISGVGAGRSRLTPSRIVSMMNACMVLNEKALDQIFNQCGYGIFENYSNDPTTPPLVILSVVGDQSSGKSFLLNLLLYFLQKGEDGNWLNMFKKKGVFEPGFYSKNISNKDQNTDYSNGIFAWPQLFSYKDPTLETHFNVLLLDSHAENDADQSALEKLCCLLSSSIIDNQMKTFKTHLLENLKAVKSFVSEKQFDVQQRLKITTNEFPDVCAQFNFVIRDFAQHSEFPWGKEDKARQFITGGLASTSPALIPDFERLKGLSKCFLVKPPEPSIVVTNGKLQFDGKFETQLKLMCHKIMESLVPKRPCGLRLQELFITSVGIVNSYYLKQRQIETLASPLSMYQNTTGESVGSFLSVDNEDVEMEDVSKLPPFQPCKNRAEIPGLRPTMPLTLTKIAESEWNEGNWTQHRTEPNRNPVTPSASLSHTISNNTIPNPHDQKVSASQSDNGTADRHQLNVLKQNFETNSSNPSNYSHSAYFYKNKETQNSTNVFKMSPTFRTCEDIDAMVLPKITELKEKYKSFMDKFNADSNEAHDEYSGSATSELGRFLNDNNIEEETKRLEWVEQFEKDLQFLFRQIKTTKRAQHIENVRCNQTLPPSSEAEPEGEGYLIAGQISPELLGADKTLNVHDPTVRTGVMEDCLTQSENGIDEIQIENFWQQSFSQLKDELHPWVIDLTDLKIHCRKSAQEVLRENLRRTLNVFFFGPRQQLEKAIRDRPNFKKCLDYLTQLQNCFNSYKTGMEKQFDMNRSFTEQHFLSIHQNLVDSTMLAFKTQAQVLKNLLDLGLQRFKSQYSQRNSFVNQNELNSAEKLLPSLIAFHRDMMAELTKDKFIMPNKLLELHKLVEAETLEGFWKSCDFKPNQGIDSKLDISGLKQQFEKNLRHLENSNKLKAEKVKIGIKNLLKEYRSMYNYGMDKFLPHRGPHREKLELEKQHKECLEKACSSLAIEIKKLEVKIPYEEHVSILKENINQDWIEIMKSNEKLKQKFDKDARKLYEEEDKEMKRQEAMKELKEFSKSKDQIRPSPQASVAITPPHIAATTSYTIAPLLQRNNKPTTIFRPPSEILTPELPRIAIEFAFTKVRVGWMDNGDFNIFTNVWTEDFTSTSIAFDHNSRVLIGIEAENHEPKLDTVLLANLFGDITHYPAENVPIIKDGIRQEFRFELLVALFLARIKADVENKLEGRWTKAVITVPLCFTSVQRQAMKDAAVLAGFQSNRLINDTTAAAFCFFRKNPKHNKSLLVGVAQNHESYFDAAVYELQQNGKSGLELLSKASCGNLHSSTHVPQTILAKFKKFCNRLVGSDCDHIRSMISAMVGDRHQDLTVNICINYGAEDSFNNLVNRYGRPPGIDPNTQLYIIKGAAMFGLSLETHGNANVLKVKDKASYTLQRILSKSRSTSKLPLMLFDGYQILSGSKVYNETTIGDLSQCDEDMHIEVHECSLQQQHIVGKLTIKTSIVSKELHDKQKKAPEIKVKCTLSNEGIFAVEKTISSRGKGDQILQFLWSSPNLENFRLEGLKEQVASIIKDEKMEAFENAKLHLQNLVNEIQPRIHSIKSIIGKKVMEKEIENAAAILIHPKTTQQQLDNKLELLEGLRDKYLK